MLLYYECPTPIFHFAKRRNRTHHHHTIQKSGSKSDDLLKKNELREIRFHDLRHTCASLLLNKGKTNGVTLKDIQVWLGHSDFSTTANTYSHLDANSKVSSLNTLAGVVNI